MSLSHYFNFENREEEGSGTGWRGQGDEDEDNESAEERGPQHHQSDSTIPPRASNIIDKIIINNIFYASSENLIKNSLFGLD